MKLSSDEGRALAFVVGLIALAGIARVVTRPDARAVPAAAEVDAAALEDSSQSALERERAAARPLGADERIDVNGAGAQELDRLPGVGPALAARLVAERERAGAYDSAADLRTVPGLGAALLERLAPHLSFGPGEGLSRRAPPARGAADGEIPGSPGYRNPVGALDAVGSDAASARPRRRTSEDAGISRRPVTPSRPPALPPSTGELLDLNSASAEQLDALPGIGPALAARIVAKRDSLHGFHGVEDLLKVRGIGAATLRRLQPFFRS